MSDERRDEWRNVVNRGGQRLNEWGERNETESELYCKEARKLEALSALIGRIEKVLTIRRILQETEVKERWLSGEGQWNPNT